MYTNPDEAAYCISRIARSQALAAASPDSCARASHTGIAKAYAARLVSLTMTTLRSPVASPAMILGTVNA